MTCPQGHESITWTPNIDRWGNPGIQVRFSRSECFKCPRKEQCCRSKKDGRTLRFLPKPEHEAIEDLRRQMETPEWLTHYHRRAGVEGTISQGVRAFGLRKARYKGLEKVSLQHILTATAINVVRIGAWLSGTPHELTRISNFALLRTPKDC